MTATTPPPATAGPMSAGPASATSNGSVNGTSQ